MWPEFKRISISRMHSVDLR